VQTNAATDSIRPRTPTEKVGQRRGVTMTLCIMEPQIAEGKFWQRAIGASLWALQVATDVGDLKIVTLSGEEPVKQQRMRCARIVILTVIIKGAHEIQLCRHFPMRVGSIVMTSIDGIPDCLQRIALGPVRQQFQFVVSSNFLYEQLLAKKSVRRPPDSVNSSNP
jgi:hypothetical protein